MRKRPQRASPPAAARCSSLRSTLARRDAPRSAATRRGRPSASGRPAGALGAQAVNEPGTWNFSNLETDRPDTAGFYADLFGWSIEDLGYATMVRRPGYGDHLEATVDPDIRARQRSGGAPPGFEDAIAFVVPLEPDMRPHWHVAFSVADRDAAVDSARRLGADVLGAEDTQWTRTALIRDPQGGVFTASQFKPAG